MNHAVSQRTLRVRAGRVHLQKLGQCHKQFLHRLPFPVLREVAGKGLGVGREVLSPANSVHSNACLLHKALERLGRGDADVLRPRLLRAAMDGEFGPCCG